MGLGDIPSADWMVFSASSVVLSVAVLHTTTMPMFLGL
jgi:hypothetical protein